MLCGQEDEGKGTLQIRLMNKMRTVMEKFTGQNY